LAGKTRRLTQKQKEAFQLLALVSVVVLIVFLTYCDIKFSENDPNFAGSATEEPTHSYLSFWEDMKLDIILPIGELYRTPQRDAYQAATLRLVIPKLDLDCLVQDGTELEKLKKGPGLYSYSQTPDWYNTNTCIAAHRDIYGKEFYYLDTLGEGDFIYLVYRGKVFKYLYRYTVIIEPANWDPIRVFSDCRVTLVTCDPIGTSRTRMVVVGTVISYEDYSDSYVFVK
jgi:sortase A